MTAPQAGAVSHDTMDWHAIDWQKSHSMVRRLQTRIVKATQENRWGKVKALQHLLTHSFSGKSIAVKRVTENPGKRTPGVDGETWHTPEHKATAINKLTSRGYQPLALRRVYLVKGKKRRPLGIPALIDRAQQALHLLALDPIAETTADPNSYGFRSERSAADAIDQCFIVLSRKSSASWILEGDIRSCFDKISHQWLINNIPMDKVVLKKWLKAGFIDQTVFYETVEGTPQGGICSPVLARMALNGLERMLKEKYSQKSIEGKKGKVNVVMYADDFIITASSRELLEKEIKPLVISFLHERGLELSAKKTSITHIEDGFDFLGQNIRKYKGKLLIKPSAKSIKNFLDKVRKIIKGNKQATTANLIGLLNPVIRGWANYHKHVVSKMTFEAVDSAIFKVLWQWARRRHPNKAGQWIKKRYFNIGSNNRWLFGVNITGENGQARQLRLFRAGSIPITRHIKIQGNANPYDSQWEVYFEKRIGLQMLNNLKTRKRLLRLWFLQKGICINCFQPITKQSGWNIHHIEHKMNGGSDKINNLVLLHPNCHRQVHSQRLTVVKAASNDLCVIKA